MIPPNAKRKNSDQTPNPMFHKRPSHRMLELTVLVRHRQGDTIMTAKLSHHQLPSGEARIEWPYSLSLSAFGYARYTNCLEGALTGGPFYHINPQVKASLQATSGFKAVDDWGQSLVFVSAQAMLTETLTEKVEIAQYYSYQRAFARQEIYSYGTHTIGVSLSLHTSQRVSVDLIYEFIYGNPFRAIEQRGRDKTDQYGNNPYPQRGRNAFGQQLIKEDTYQHQIEVSLRYDLSKRYFTNLQYSFHTLNGRSGVSSYHTGTMAIGVRF